MQEIQNARNATMQNLQKFATIRMQNAKNEM